MKYSTSLFNSIKDALAKKSNSSDGNFKDFLKLEIGKTYLVRLIPNLAHPERTIFHYYHHLWNSTVTQELVSVLCPATVKERCPIDEYRSKIYKTNDKAEIEKIKPIKRNENWLVNVFVIKDPTNPDNQGQTKILRYGKQLDKIITSAMEGDDAEDFGAKIFDLSENGCNLRIKVEENEGGYPTYVASRFLTPSALEGDPDQDEIYNSVKSLDTIFELKPYDEIQKLLNVHFLGKTEEVASRPAAKQASKPEPEEDEYESYSTPQSKQTETVEEESPIDDRIHDILKDL
jgi:gp32 DNA binding protein like